MRCTSKMIAKKLLCLCIAALFVVGCGSEKAVLERPYSLSGSPVNGTSGSYFAQNLCVTENFDYGLDQVDSQLAEGAGVFNLTKQQVEYSQNLFGKLYPASTTKILTAYIIIRGGDPEDIVTVSDTALQGLSGTSVCGLQKGDKISVKNLLYGLLMVSGNDAANVLAEYYSGSVEAFANVMNEEAKRLGATKSHFVNANGLSDENHYTTVYDMYLIFQEAVKQKEFAQIIQTDSIEVSYQDANGQTVTKTWKNTCKYTNKEHAAPEGITVIGGKTGTTNAAGYCLVLYSVNTNGEQIVSIVFKADGRNNLYYLMDQLLKQFAD